LRERAAQARYLNRLSKDINSSKWVEPSRKRYLKIALLCFVVVLLLYPFESTVVPAWKLRVVNDAGQACAEMQVNEGWGHYSLELNSTGQSEFRFTNEEGVVEFPSRKIRASLVRRIAMPIVANAMTIAHGSTGKSGYVFATGMKDGPFLNYDPGKPMPKELAVEKCYRANPEEAFGAESP